MRLFRSPVIAKYLFKSGIWKGKDKTAVYLTFDDGPHPEITPWVLDLLEKENIKATFFCVGQNAKKYPHLIEHILQAGHRIGNHTMTHENGTKTPFQTYIESVKEAGNFTSENLFRPPYGRITPKQLKSVAKEMKVVFWSWISYDFDSTLASNIIIEKAKKIKGGDILVFHDSEKAEKNLKEALPSIIHQLKAKQLQFKNTY